MNFTNALEKFSELFKANKKLFLAVALAAASFFVGRSCAPAAAPAEKIVERVEYKDRIVEKIVEVEKRVEVKGKDRIVYREKIVRPDGTTIEKELEKEKEDTRVDTDKQTSKDTVRTVEVERRVEVEKIVRAEPRFKVGALVGYDLMHLTGARGLNLNGAVIGAQAEIRLAGPVWLGITAQTNGVVGGVVSVSF